MKKYFLAAVVINAFIFPFTAQAGTFTYDSDSGKRPSNFYKLVNSYDEELCPLALGKLNESLNGKKLGDHSESIFLKNSGTPDWETTYPHQSALPVEMFHIKFGKEQKETYFYRFWTWHSISYPMLVWFDKQLTKEQSDNVLKAYIAAPDERKGAVEHPHTDLDAIRKNFPALKWDAAYFGYHLMPSPIILSDEESPLMAEGLLPGNKICDQKYDVLISKVEESKLTPICHIQSRQKIACKQ